MMRIDSISILVTSSICLFNILLSKTTHASGPTTTPTIRTRPHCDNDQDCEDYEARNSSTCVTGCSTLTCGVSTICYEDNHVPRCKCLQGYEGDAYGNGCVKSKTACNEDRDCEDDDLCHGNFCTFGCERLVCGINTICHVQNHVPICECKAGYRGDAYGFGCVGPKKACNGDQDCKDYDVCHENLCTFQCDRIECGKNAFCHVQSHSPICECHTGFKGDAYGNGCVESKKACNKGQDCEANEVCDSNTCAVGCNWGSCGIHTSCRVNNHIRICECDEGYEGDAYDQGCVKSEKGCFDDQQCEEYEVCNDNICTSECGLLECGPNANCFINNHIPECKCLQGYEGDAYGEGCSKSKKDCHNDQHCEDYEVYNNDTSTSECGLQGCGPNAACSVTNHVPICKCLEGYEGDAYDKGCIKFKQVCNRDQDCRDYKATNSSTCVSGCKLLICGANAICDIKNHVPTCECLPGYEGNAYGKGCVKSKRVCNRDQDCRDNEICNGNICMPGCEWLVCGINTYCAVNNHHPTCECLWRFDDDVYGRGCVKSNKGCYNNQHCQEYEVCNNGTCTSECDLLGCGLNTACYINNPVSQCKCLQGYEGDPYGKGCVKSKKVCNSDQDCENYEVRNCNTCVVGCGLLVYVLLMTVFM